MSASLVTARAALPILEELGEWMALGFYEGLDLPWPRAYGLAWRRLYERMAIDIPADRCLLPHDPFSGARTFADSRAWWHAAGFICDFNHDAGLRVHRDIAAEKAAAFPQHASFIAALCDDLEARLPHFGGYTHSNPDIRRVVDDGFLAIEAELQAQLAATPEAGEADEARQLLLALQDYACGVRAFHTRATAAIRVAARTAGARRDELSHIADSFAHAFLHPARTFLEGLLAVHFTWLLDGCDSLGRLDQALGALYERDLASGAITPAFAQRLLDELWRQFDRLNGWNIQLGGYTPDGRDGANALTRACIAACARNRCLRPNVALRLTCATPDDVLAAALAALATGSGRPALYNDDLYLATLLDLDLGLTPEDARELGFGGCTETMIGGMSNVGSLEGELNLAKALELALHDGVDPVAGRQAGPRTGPFAGHATFEAFLDAVRRQIAHQTETFVAENRRALAQRVHRGDPKLARTLFTRDCVARRRSFEAGGARYNWAVVTYQGIANLIDGLAAVRQCVYDERSIAPETLLAALRADFDGYPEVRQRLLAAPKFGNDDPRVDALGGEIVGDAWRLLLRHETPRGGRYLPSCILFSTYLDAGRTVGATPDGRQAGTVLTDSVGPAQGRDTHGPTAMLRSVLALPLALAIGTPVLNIRFQQQLLRSPDGLRGIADLIRAFFAGGGLQIQLTAVSSEAMRAAQAHPEAHRDLIVRIGGFSEYFTALPREMQDSVIARAEYALPGGR